MSVSHSLHAYRMDRIWLKAPTAEKCVPLLAHDRWPLNTSQLNQIEYYSQFYDTV